MYTSDYIRIYRDERLDWTFQEAGAWHLWMYIRMNAASADSLQRVGSTNTIEAVKFGQLLTSKRFLSEQLHMSVRRIDYLLGRLSEGKYIEIKEDANSILINVPEYERFCPMQDYEPSILWRPRGLQDMAQVDLSESRVSAATSDIEPVSASIEEQTPIPVSTSVMHPVMPQVVHPVQQPSVQTQSENLQNFSESPIVVEEDKKKEINNISTTTSTMREEDFFERLKHSEKDLESARKNMKLENIPDVLEQLDCFEFYIRSINKIHKSYGDFTTHFTSWYELRVEAKSRKKSAATKNDNSVPRYEKKRRWQDHAGIDSNATSEDDYDELI